MSSSPIRKKSGLLETGFGRFEVSERVETADWMFVCCYVSP